MNAPRISTKGGKTHTHTQTLGCEYMEFLWFGFIMSRRLTSRTHHRNAHTGKQNKGKRTVSEPFRSRP